MVGFLIGTTGARQGSVTPEPPHSYLNETNTLAAAMIANGDTVTDAYKQGIDSVIRVLQRNGAWTEMARLFLVSGSIASSKMDWKNPTNVWTHTGGGSVNFEAYNYWQFDGTSEAEWNMNGNTAPMAQNDAHIAAFFVSNADNDYDVGTVTNNRIRLGHRDGESLARLHTSNGVTTSGLGSSSIGHILFDITASAAYTHYKDGVSRATGSLTTLEDTAELTMATNIAGAGKSLKKFFGVHAGGFLSATQVADVVEAFYMYGEVCLDVTGKTFKNYTEECALFADADDQTAFRHPNGHTVRAQNVEASYSFKRSGDPRYPGLSRFDHRGTESAASGTRSELSYDNVADVIDLLDDWQIAMYFYIESGATYDTYNIIAQYHAADSVGDFSPPWSVSLNSSGKLTMTTNYSPSIGGLPGNVVNTNLYTSASAITADIWHHLWVRCKADPAGSGSILQMKLDGFQRVNSTEKLGIVADPGGYFKDGLYKAGTSGKNVAVWKMDTQFGIGLDLTTHRDPEIVLPFGTLAAIPSS